MTMNLPDCQAELPDPADPQTWRVCGEPYEHLSHGGADLAVRLNLDVMPHRYAYYCRECGTLYAPLRGGQCADCRSHPAAEPPDDSHYRQSMRDAGRGGLLR